MSGVFDIIQCKTSVAFVNKDSSVIYLNNPPMLCCSEIGLKNRYQWWFCCQ